VGAKRGRSPLISRRAGRRGHRPDPSKQGRANEPDGSGYERSPASDRRRSSACVEKNIAHIERSNAGAGCGTRPAGGGICRTGGQLGRPALLRRRSSKASRTRRLLRITIAQIPKGRLSNQSRLVNGEMATRQARKTNS